jgi:hypothetical protein
VLTAVAFVKQRLVILVDGDEKATSAGINRG